jgi:hypothetical protein
MKLRDLIDRLNWIDANSPDTEVRFENAFVKNKWFETEQCFLVDARANNAAGCIITLAATEEFAANYQRYADRK